VLSGVRLDDAPSPPALKIKRKESRCLSAWIQVPLVYSLVTTCNPIKEQDHENNDHDPEVGMGAETTDAPSRKRLSKGERRRFTPSAKCARFGPGIRRDHWNYVPVLRYFRTIGGDPPFMAGGQVW
jgi:hypothetical protein